MMLSIRVYHDHTHDNNLKAAAALPVRHVHYEPAERASRRLSVRVLEFCANQPLVALPHEPQRRPVQLRWVNNRPLLGVLGVRQRKRASAPTIRVSTGRGQVCPRKCKPNSYQALPLGIYKLRRHADHVAAVDVPDEAEVL